MFNRKSRFISPITITCSLKLTTPYVEIASFVELLVYENCLID